MIQSKIEEAIPVWIWVLSPIVCNPIFNRFVPEIVSDDFAITRGLLGVGMAALWGTLIGNVWNRWWAPRAQAQSDADAADALKAEPPPPTTPPKPERRDDIVIEIVADDVPAPRAHGANRAP